MLIMRTYTTPVERRNRTWPILLLLLAWDPIQGLLAFDNASVAMGKNFTNYIQKIAGSTVAFEMVAIPGGTITIGSPESEPGRNTNDGPRKAVTVKPFWMGRYEVSWQEYYPFVFVDPPEIIRQGNKLEGKIDQDGISHPTAPYGSVYRDRGEKGYPAIGMGLPAAYEYCRWLNKKTGKRYRLPTEEEWEYACRAGSTNTFFWGNNAALAKEYGWFTNNASDTTQPIGKLKPNAFGLFDIVGNVAEWCFDPQKPAVFVARGGAFSESIDQLRCASRMIETPEWNELDPQIPQSIWWLASADWVGFRVVCSLDESAATAADKSVLELFPPPRAEAKPSDAKANFLRFCAVCHGVNGQGNTGTGKRLKARDYTNPAVKTALKTETMLTAIKDGLVANGMEVMSPFSHQLSNDEIQALVDYMKKF